MKVLDPGHNYTLTAYDSKMRRRDDYHNYECLIFMKREGSGYPGNYGAHAGTNCQEVLRVLIDRVIYLDNQIKCEENKIIVKHLREALWQFEVRAADRHGKTFPFTSHNIELRPTDPKDGHIIK